MPSHSFDPADEIKRAYRGAMKEPSFFTVNELQEAWLEWMTQTILPLLDKLDPFPMRPKSPHRSGAGDGEGGR